MGEFRGLFWTFWNWLTRDTPELFVSMWIGLMGETWVRFGLRVTFVCFAGFLIYSLWTRLSDIGDRNPLVTIGGSAVLMVLVAAGFGAYYAGMWRELAPRWTP